MKHIGANNLILPDKLGVTNDEALTVINNDLHSYLPYHKFLATSVLASSVRITSTLFCATAQFDDCIAQRTWKYIQKSVHKVHKYVCGHSN